MYSYSGIWREYFFLCVIVRTICTPCQLFLVCLLGTVQGEEFLICHHCLLADRFLGSKATIDCKCIIKNEIKHHNSGKEAF